MTTRASLLAAAAVLLAAPPALADGASEAAELLKNAKAALASGNVAGACPLFAQAYALDAAPVTLQSLALCHEQNGKWVSAAARFEELKSGAKSAVPPQTARIKLADEHLAKLSARFSNVSLVVDDDIAPLLEVRIDDVPYARAEWATAIAVDPGGHEVVVRSPGKVPYKTTLVVSAEPSVYHLTIPPLADLATTVPAPARPTTPSAETRAPADGDRSLRRTGLVIGGAGVAVAIAGGVFGFLAIQKNGDAEDRCRGAPLAGEFDASGHCLKGSSAVRDSNGLRDDARLFANVANVTIPIGLLAVAVGAYIVVVQSKSDAALRIGPAPGGASLGGVF